MKREERVPSDKKLEELILFICQRSLGDKRFGAVKLNKLLFFCDFAAYVKLGRAITWQEYQKLEHGPAPRRIVPTLGKLQGDGALAQAEHDFYGRRQVRSVALRDPDLSLFTVEEIALVTEMIGEFWGKNATEMSEISHEFNGWRLASDGETIPYDVALLNVVKATPQDRILSEEVREKLRATRSA
jgi:hypothetical protein